jgi:hypothetical protein
MKSVASLNLVVDAPADLAIFQYLRFDICRGCTLNRFCLRRLLISRSVVRVEVSLHRLHDFGDGIFLQTLGPKPRPLVEVWLCQQHS